MKKLTVTLKQHTPLIHFQHEQEGATLRSSEVKPRLDRFLFPIIGGNENYIQYGKEQAFKEKIDFDSRTKLERGILIAKNKNWLVGSGQHNSLDFKIKILSPNKKDLSILTNNFPFVLANMGKKTNEEKVDFSLYSSLEVIIQSPHEEIINIIEDNIGAFFAKNNFGMRKSKGFGSFSISLINGSTEKCHSTYYYMKKGQPYLRFSIESISEEYKRFNALFSVIDFNDYP